MNTLHIARDVFAFLMVGLLLMLASEETKVIDTTHSTQQACVINIPGFKFKKEISVKQLDQQPSKCFDVNFPIQILIPDGGKRMVTSSQVLDEFIMDWFEKNPNSNNEPTFQYPFGITLENGQKLLVENETQFLSVADACDEQVLEENYASVNTFCFDFIYPIQLIAPNGKIQKVNSADQVDYAIQLWNTQNPSSSKELSIQFPIKIKFDDGIVIKLEEVNALSAAIQFCEGDSLEYDESEEEDNEEPSNTTVSTPVIGA